MVTGDGSISKIRDVRMNLAGSEQAGIRKI
jgi:hypothetical protein